MIDALAFGADVALDVAAGLTNHGDGGADRDSRSLFPLRRSPFPGVLELALPDTEPRALGDGFLSCESSMRISRPVEGMAVGDEPFLHRSTISTSAIADEAAILIPFDKPAGDRS